MYGPVPYIPLTVADSESKAANFKSNGSALSFKPLTNAEGCRLVVSPPSTRPPNQTATKGEPSEHGVHTGVGALRDIALLSRGDAFVGSRKSTFSTLIAELLVHHFVAKRGQTTRPPVVLCDRECVGAAGPRYNWSPWTEADTVTWLECAKAAARRRSTINGQTAPLI